MKNVGKCNQFQIHIWISTGMNIDKSSLTEINVASTNLLVFVEHKVQREPFPRVAES